uniref:Uncharacterized protein n=1 Tax=Triticum urartu TaxID=4572 RepID=A0A8R7UHS7_TRIUA
AAPTTPPPSLPNPSPGHPVLPFLVRRRPYLSSSADLPFGGSSAAIAGFGRAGHRCCSDLAALVVGAAGSGCSGPHTRRPGCSTLHRHFPHHHSICLARIRERVRPGV